VPLPVGGQYVLVEPGASPVLYVTRSETEDKADGGSGGGIGSAILGIFSNLPVPTLPPFLANLPFLPSSGESTTTAATPDENTTEKTPTRNPEKVRTPKPKEN
jgi:hypothetical protein